MQGSVDEQDLLYTHSLVSIQDIEDANLAACPQAQFWVESRSIIRNIQQRYDYPFLFLKRASSRLPSAKGNVSKLCYRCGTGSDVHEQAGQLLSAYPETLMAAS